MPHPLKPGQFLRNHQLLKIIMPITSQKSILGNNSFLGFENAFEANAPRETRLSIPDSISALRKIKGMGNNMISITIITPQFFLICMIILLTEDCQ